GSSARKNAKASTRLPFMIVLQRRTGMSAACASGARRTVSFSEYGQIGGGCVGGIICPCKVASAKDGGRPSAICARLTAAGNIAATKLRHLNAHAVESLCSSEGGQQGMSA